MKRDTLKLFRTIETLFTVKDLDSLLENVLTEARQFVEADAGTIYLATRGSLYFSYVQNDTLFRGETKDKYIPSGASLPIDKASLAGYVAKTGETVLIDDVYHIKSDLSFSFNPSFDQKTNYHTRSILCVPLKTRETVLCETPTFLAMSCIVDIRQPCEEMSNLRNAYVCINSYAQNSTLLGSMSTIPSG